MPLIIPGAIPGIPIPEPIPGIPIMPLGAGLPEWIVWLTRCS